MLMVCHLLGIRNVILHRVRMIVGSFLRQDLQIHAHAARRVAGSDARLNSKFMAGLLHQA